MKLCIDCKIQEVEATTLDFCGERNLTELSTLNLKNIILNSNIIYSLV